MDKTGDKSSGACRSKFFFLYKYMCECVCNTADGTRVFVTVRDYYINLEKEENYLVYTVHTHIHTNIHL